MQRLIFLLAFAFICLSANAQSEEPEIIRSGLLKGTGNICPGVLLKPSVLTLYINGDLEGYISKRVSVRGDFSYYLESKSNKNTLKHNHSVFFGLSYHIPVKRWDPFIGLYPGLSVVQGYQDDNLTPSTVQAVPVISAIAGFHYYFSRYFNFYFTTRYVGGTYFGDRSIPVSLHEFRFMAGLGFNINMIKKSS